MEELRRFERKEAIDLSIVQNGEVKGKVLDLSPAGAKLSLNENWKEGDSVSFSIRFAEWTQFPDLEIEAKVIWVQEDRIGVEFLNFENLDLDTLNDYYRLLAEKKKEVLED